MTISRFFTVENMTGDTNAAGTAYHFRAPEFTQLFLDGVSAAIILFFYISHLAKVNKIIPQKFKLLFPK
jgi:hypothetical protein